MPNIQTASTPRNCDNSACRHQQRVGVQDLFTTRVPGPHGGSRNAPAFRCSVCARATALDPRFLPRNAIETLPSEDEYDALSAPLAWESTGRGRNLLKQRIKGATSRHGYAIAYTRSANGVESRPYPLSDQKDLLTRLDRDQIELLLISGIGSDGRRWRTIFHPRHGASAIRGSIDPSSSSVRAILSLSDFPAEPIAIAA